MLAPMTDDQVIEWARMEREILARIRERMSREQCGDAFRGLTVTAEVRNLSIPTNQGSDCRSNDYGEEINQETRNRRGGPGA